MNIAVPSTMQSASGTADLLESKPFSFLRKTSAPGGGGARRALTALGTNNAKLNLSQAQSNIAIAQEEFASIWNFNPVKEVPLAPGIYQWESIIGSSDKNIIPSLSEEVVKDTTFLKDITNAKLTTSVTPSVKLEDKDLHKTKLDDLENNPTVISSCTKHENSDSEDTSDSKNRKQGLSLSFEKHLVSTHKVLSKSQICITEFFQLQKRKSNYHCDGSKSIKPPTKKLRSMH